MKDQHLKDLQDRLRKAENQVLALTAENNNLRNIGYAWKDKYTDLRNTLSSLKYREEPR